LCSCSVFLVPCFDEVIILPHHAAGDGSAGFLFSVYATNVDAEHVYIIAYFAVLSHVTITSSHLYL
jgi:hypothetical protein